MACSVFLFCVLLLLLLLLLFFVSYKATQNLRTFSRQVRAGGFPVLFRKIPVQIWLGRSCIVHRYRYIFFNYFLHHDVLLNVMKILNNLRLHNTLLHNVIARAKCFDYLSVILRSIFLSIESQDAMHTQGSHRIYIHGIHKIK